ncbi:FecR domain-containing protein [Mucilaginibacter sp. BJC16-A38]|uniref:FecR family protein n=1 Tax=Mucilaginibacter phenanthrenivorans TaxID=1234842 RepID=UPI002157C427|nr:FecR family protein [Mucilaginibacter phenanthrenivorans]MCR8556699.1 FecR domain-containing protein [Mucilaginibacter phenanthrenivorans]
MNSSDFNIENLATNESFVNYCYRLNQDDIIYWENILVTHPEFKNNIEQARELCLSLAIKVSPAEKALQLSKLKLEIEALEADNSNISISNRPVRKLWAWASIAASILILTAIYLTYNISSTPAAAILYSRVSTSTYHLTSATAFDERKKVVLPDGTSVILNGSSSLKIANNYNQKTRYVLLSGEAFFLVKKDHTRPFVVLTGKTATTALGTSFKVQSYPSETTATVMLATGKVKVESTQSSNIDDVKLTPGEQAVLKQGQLSFEKSNYNNSNLQNWIDRKLVFSNSNLNEITAKFKNIYGINIVASNLPAEGVLFTGTFINKKPSEVLEAIGFSNHFTYKQNGNTVTLNF